MIIMHLRAQQADQTVAVVAAAPEGVYRGLLVG